MKLAEKEGQSTAEGVRVRKDGTFYWASSSLSAVHNKQGRLIGFAKVIKDISKEKEEEQKRDEFIGIASHELKNPIATLSLYSELLGERLRLEHDKTNLQMLRDIQGQSARLVTLIDDLMMVSQIDSGKLELLQKEFDLNALIKKTTHHIQSGSTTHKIIRVGTALRHVRGDEDQIGRVLTNLITNAVKYSIRANKIIVRVAKKGTKMIVSVQDFGPGIETVDRNEIFKRFYRGRGQKNGKVAGFGLGLFICSEIIKKHHQKIWVKSKKGLGSTFFFSLASVR